MLNHTHDLISTPEVYLTNHTEPYIRWDEVLYRNDLRGNINFCYRTIFETYCTNFPEKKDEYEVLLKLYHFDYRRTVLNIEMKHVEEEIELDKDLIK